MWIRLQFDAARRYFGRATAADPRFAPGWLAYGDAFAAQDESDQVRFLHPFECAGSILDSPSPCTPLTPLQASFVTLHGGLCGCATLLANYDSM